VGDRSAVQESSVGTSLLSGLLQRRQKLVLHIMTNVGKLIVGEFFLYSYEYSYLLLLIKIEI